jgi:uncharacterized protein YfaP (DUF2135 family)
MRTRVALRGTAALLLLAGCGDAGSEGGFGVPRQPADAPLVGTRTEIRGTVRVEANGCLTLDTGNRAARWIVWPAGQEEEQGQPVLAGRVVADGDEVTGSGAEMSAAVLPGWSNDSSYFRSYGSFCAAGERGIVVLDDVARA